MLYGAMTATCYSSEITMQFFASLVITEPQFKYPPFSQLPPLFSLHIFCHINNHILWIFKSNESCVQKISSSTADKRGDLSSHVGSNSQSMVMVVFSS